MSQRFIAEGKVLQFQIPKHSWQYIQVGITHQIQPFQFGQTIEGDGQTFQAIPG